MPDGIAIVAFVLGAIAGNLFCRSLFRTQIAALRDQVASLKARLELRRSDDEKDFLDTFRSVLRQILEEDYRATVSP